MSADKELAAVSPAALGLVGSVVADVPWGSGNVSPKEKEGDYCICF